MRKPVASFAWIAVVFAAICLPLVFSDVENNYSADERTWHLPAVRQIREHWPALDLTRDSLSAISPGYHYVLATASKLTGDGRRALRLITWTVSLAILIVLWRGFAPVAPAWAGAAILPLACSNFFVKSASWVVTDNAGLLCVAGVLSLTFLHSCPRSLTGAGIMAGLATFMRQLHVWTAVPVALHAWQERRNVTRTRWRVAIVAGMMLPAAVVGVLVWHWRGLVPPVWQTTVAGSEGSAAASLAYLLSVYGLFGAVYFAATRAPGEKFEWRHPWVLGAAAVGLVVAVAAPTNYSMPAGRWGGYLWSATHHLPAIGQRSLVFIVLAPVGGALLAVMTRQLGRRADSATAGLWLASYAAWAATFLPNRLVFHRYFEPMTLLFLIFWILLLLRSTRESAGQRKWPLHALWVAQVILTVATAHFETYGRAWSQ